ncbi:SusC/RagA family TonB-linked outer membrane protein [Dyadobacter sp.]|uniref:SusC/RagA family TonB-linked outer membrane protein n=1 Tax=Dyadobacter sp. TaxID=1914288 RepID=UPI0025B9896B|nr:SusC/RagA family TonB-linked outer membrane protein [Dyadobacter sp.]
MNPHVPLAKAFGLYAMLSLCPPPGFGQLLASAHPLQAETRQTQPVRLRDALLKLKESYGADILFEEKLLDDLKVSSAAVNPSRTLEQNLDALLASTGLKYKKIKENTYVLLASKDRRKKDGGTVPVRESSALPQDSPLASLSPVTRAEVAESAVRGTVVDAKGEPLIGVSVLVKGTTRGTATDVAGKYEIAVDDASAVLVFSFVGYVRKEVVVGAQSEVNVTLAEDTQNLSEVVVTALGIKRDKRALGYSVQEIGGEAISTAKEANLATTLAGKMAGVQVTRSANGAGGSSRVVIRGSNSLVGNSQPLYVIDGIPMDNSNPNSPSSTGGIDYGDGISNINPEDVESISVLKGPNAAALYGQRGSNGVVLITTKSGKSRKGIGIKYGVDYSVGDALVLPDFQDEYGQGLDGAFTHFRGNDGKIYTWAAAQAGNIQGMPKASGGRDRFTRSSWGARMDGQQYEDQWGNVLNFTPQPNTFQTFFRKEKQVVNNLSLEGGNDNINYRLSYGRTDIDGYTPGNTLKRNNVNLRTVGKITPKLELDVKANYIGQKGANRPTVSDASDNPAYLFISQPRSMPMSILANSAWTAEDVAKQLGYGTVPFVGMEKTYATNSSTANPYWTVDHTRNSDDRQRLLGLIRLSYQFNDWIRLTAKTGTDFYTDQRLRYREKGTYQSANRNGDISEQVTRVREDNSDILLSLTPQLTKDISLGLNLGANHQKFYSRTTGNTGTEFIVPGLYAINNTLINSYVFGLTESSINSVYLSGQLGYKEYLFLDFSARNDWSSTLSPANNSFFYPAVSASFVVTDAFNIRSNTLSFLKLRASVAQAGSSGSPYQLTGTYSLDQVAHGGVPLASFSSTIPDPNLKNELTTSIEFGVEARFFKNRAGLAFAYYNASTKNQILDVPLPPSSTFASRRINAGEIRNRGVELTLNGTPIKTADGFTWDAAFNFSRNRNQVVALAEGVDTYVLGADRGVNVVAEPGKPFGTLIGNGFQWLRDENGNRLIDPTTGLPLKSNSKILYELGNALPNWIGGFNNTFRYKGISLSGLFDISQGGKIYSQSLREELVYGTIKKTLPGRDGTYVADGVVASKSDNGKWVGTGQANTKQVRAQDYWNVVAPDKDNVIPEEMLNDASYIMFRELTLNYQLPNTLISRTPFKSIRAGIYGRNLFYVQRKTEGFAPEASSFNVNNSSLGLESTALPLLRYFGVSLNVEL